MDDYKKKNLLERMDDMVTWTGIPQLADSSTIRRRRLRWFPVVALLAATCGMAVILATPGKYWLGFMMVMLGVGISIFFPIVGPLKQSLNPHDDADEREKALRHDSYFFAFAVICGVAFLSTWILIGLTVWQDWPREMLLRAMMSFSFFIMVLFSAVPTLYASWKLREPVDDGD